ncbi:methyltransferase domain-containing protein [Candidatus Poribacteria bacterium]|nr:methyltransferase domain-containing protein [Candidatus Poribacteria bacterium]
MNSQQNIEIKASDKNRVCPPQNVSHFDNFLRPLVHNPRMIFGPYVKPGMKVLDVGCGKGFASIGLARLVGEEGLVISADLQPEMLGMVEERAISEGLSDRIKLHQCKADSIGLDEDLDFVVAFWMYHELPDGKSFLDELFSLLNPGGHLFLAEPKIHTSKGEFEEAVKETQKAGFVISKKPRIFFSRAVVLRKE